MRYCKTIWITIALLSWNLPGQAQVEKQFDALLLRSDSLFKEHKYDSSLKLAEEAIALVRSHSSNTYLGSLASAAALHAGKCAQELNSYVKAHDYYRYALRIARATGMSGDLGNAMTALNLLHLLITGKNIAFPYPEPGLTEEKLMAFPIKAVEPAGRDSVRIYLEAGSLDGISLSVLKATLQQRVGAPAKAWPEGRGLNCYPRKVSTNSTLLTATADPDYSVSAGDLVIIRTRVPQSWRQLDLAPLILNAIIATDNYKQPVTGSRYLYYYTDSLTNRDLGRLVHDQVEEVVNQFAADTLTKTTLMQKGSKGIFAGVNVIRALSMSRPEHIRLFNGYLGEYASAYRGNQYRYSEIYATWVVNNTPLASSDLKPWLLGYPTGQQRKETADRFSEDIRERRLLSQWLDEGMLMANTDNTDSSMLMASLIRDAAHALQDSVAAAWADYLEAYSLKKTGEAPGAEKLFKEALAKFRKLHNNEGETWSLNALKNLRSSREVTVTLQTGHLFQYLMAPSPHPRYLATAGSYDKMVKIWDMIAGRCIISFQAHNDDITAISYSPNGRYLATASLDKTIRVWNAYDFSLLREYRRPKAEFSVIFTPDSRQLVTGGADSLIKFIALDNGKTVKTLKKHRDVVTSLCFLPNNENYLFSGGNDSLVYKWDLTDNNWDHWYKARGKVMQVAVTANGKYMSLTSTDTLVRVWDLETNLFYFSVKPNYSNTEQVDIAFPAFSPDGRYMALAHRDDKLDIIELEGLKEKTYRFRKEEGAGMFDMQFSRDGSYLVARMNMGGPMRIFNFADWDFENNSTISKKDIRQYANIPMAVQFTPDDNNLVVVHESISKLDLRNGSTLPLYNGVFTFLNNYILLNDAKTGIHSDMFFTRLLFYDLDKKQDVLKLGLPDAAGPEVIRRFELSADNRFVFLGGEKNTVSGFRLPEGRPLFSRKFGEGGEEGIRMIRYDSLRQRLFIIPKDNRVLIADPLTGVQTGVLAADQPQALEISPAFIYVACANSSVWKYDARTLKLIRKIKVHPSGSECYGSVMSRDYRYLVVQVADRFVTLDTRTDRVLYERYDHDYANGTMAVSHNNRLLATGGFDSRIHLYELASGKKISTIYTPRGKDFMMVDDRGHYLAPKHTLEAVNFSYNNNSYGFEQFDTRFNRPDLVLRKIGMADSSLLRTYTAAWQKRLKKMNLSEKDLTADIQLPVLRLKDKFAIKPSTSQSEYEISVECFDARYPLRSLHVLVDNNPLFGLSGLLISPASRHYSGTVKVPLAAGTNKIKVFCTNERGSASLPEYIEVNGIYTPASKPKTYFIGIAVSAYRDSSMNLAFAAKDVRDLAGSFSSMFQNFEADTLIDRDATRENILALRQKLLQTTVNDQVIISVNGHGLLSDSLDFYYATWDMDFSKPQARGLRYEELEALLDGIPARKKLMLIDACHSGALDKEEILAARQQSLPGADSSSKDSGTVKGFASRGTITRNKKAGTDANSTYEVMQNLFAELSTGNGAVIISAAGGMEYAFESATWNNGVFTYCIRKGLQEEQADKDGGNGDNKVDVGELKAYVSRKVQELTKGRQRPVSRRENLEFNWVIW